jgi:DNA-binding response OmpR family regulator
MEFWLKRNGHVVKPFINAVQMFQHIKETTPDIVLLDIHLDGEVCRYLKSNEKLKKPVFLISTYTDSNTDFKDYQADGFIPKPYNMREFPAMIKSKIMI